MRPHLTIKEVDVPEVEIWERTTVDVGEHYISLFHFHKVGDSERSNLILLTKEEAKEMVDFLEKELN